MADEPANLDELFARAKRLGIKLVRPHGTKADMPDAGKLVAMITALVEVKVQAASDLCGEQRAYHMPRLNRAFELAAELFPMDFVRAMQAARDVHGETVW